MAQQAQGLEHLDDLVAEYTPLVDRVVSRYGWSGMPREDVRQVGYLGLITAAAAYDPHAGVPFEHFAWHFIAGEIRHFLRDEGSMVRKPRWLYELDGRIRRAVARLGQRLQRVPTVTEIAAEVNVAEDGVIEVLRARESLRVASLDEIVEGSSAQPMDRAKIVHQRYDTFRLPIEDRILVAEALDRLSVLQRKVIFYLFYMDLTQTEVAQRLRISQKHVSRIMHAALGRLRTILGAAREPLEV